MVTVSEIYEICKDPQARSLLSRINLDSPCVNIYQYLGKNDDILIAIANSIAIYPCAQPGQPKSFAATFGGIVSNNRFEALLQSDLDTLTKKDLPWWVRTAARNNRVIDYQQLQSDLRIWDQGDVQLDWSSDFCWKKRT